MRYRLLLPFLLAAAVSACAPAMPPPIQTPLAIQSIQSREYEASREIVFPSVISMFQDLGYIITNADMATGLISAESAAQSSDDFESFLMGQTKVSQTKATGFVETIGTMTRLRLNFVEINQTSTDYGQTDRHDTPILNPGLYQNAFGRVENGIFLRSE